MGIEGGNSEFDDLPHILKQERKEFDPSTQAPAKKGNILDQAQKEFEEQGLTSPDAIRQWLEEKRSRQENATPSNQTEAEVSPRAKIEEQIRNLMKPGF